MYFGLGLLTASLIALVITPAVWRRAMRLARARIEAKVPMTLSEIVADKDQLRAGFAAGAEITTLEEELTSLRARPVVSDARTRTRHETVMQQRIDLHRESVEQLDHAIAAESRLETALAEYAGVATIADRISETVEAIAEIWSYEVTSSQDSRSRSARSWWRSS